MLKALSQLHLNGTIQSRLDNLEWKSEMKMPQLEDSIFIDIETDLGGNEVWMIGLLYRGEVTQFTAFAKKEERKILNQFSMYLESLPNKPLICYSRTNFDFRVLWNAAKRTKNKQLQQCMSNRAWLDFCTILGRSCERPSGSLALKHVATYFGYQLKHGDYDGLKLALGYYKRPRRDGVISKDFLRIAEEYNEDDIRIMPYLLELFADNIVFSKKFSQGYSTRFVKQMRELIKNQEVSYNISLDYRGKAKLVRLRCDAANLDKLYPRVLAAGLPVPSIYYGRETINLTWNSRLARERAADVIPIIFDKM